MVVAGRVELGAVEVLRPRQVPAAEKKVAARTGPLAHLAARSHDVFQRKARATLGKVVEAEQGPHLEVATGRLLTEQRVVLDELCLGALQRHSAAVGELGVSLVLGPVKHLVARMVVEDHALGSLPVSLEGWVEPLSTVCRRAVAQANSEE